MDASHLPSKLALLLLESIISLNSLFNHELVTKTIMVWILKILHRLMYESCGPWLVMLF